MRSRRSNLAAALMITSFAVIIITCTIPADKRSPERKVAETYCGSCHQFPEPGLLNKKTWLSSVLPAMAPRLGIYRHLGEEYPAPGRHVIATPKGIFPEKPLLSTDEWEAILKYYRENAPDTLPVPARKTPRDTALFFAARSPAMIETEPATLGLLIDSAAGQLLVANASGGTMEFYDSALKLQKKIAIQRPVVYIEKAAASPASRKSSAASQEVREKYLLTDIGTYFPSDFKEGAAWTLDSSGKREKLIQMLGRPVQILPADLDTNGKTDYLLCAYGQFDGELAWYYSPRRKYVLRRAPGAIQAEISDVNKDGRPDVWALFAQGDEGLFLFINNGGKGFEEKRLLRFPPSQGSSSFELHDFNKDGHTDILYTCGDNADFSAILKPYHGIYIYLNDGDGNFKNAWFYPVNGAYKALARDFDLDGDLDIISISHFPDLEHRPGESLLYFENQGKMEFAPQWVRGAEKGRWINMQAGDLDADGDTDIALGSFTQSPDHITKQYPGKWRNTAPFLFLENQTR